MLPVLSWYLVPFWIHPFLDFITDTPQHNHFHTLFCVENRVEGNNIEINVGYFWRCKNEDMDLAEYVVIAFPNWVRLIRVETYLKIMKQGVLPLITSLPSLLCICVPAEKRNTIQVLQYPLYSILFLQ